MSIEEYTKDEIFIGTLCELAQWDIDIVTDALDTYSRFELKRMKWWHLRKTKVYAYDFDDISKYIVQKVKEKNEPTINQSESNSDQLRPE